MLGTKFIKVLMSILYWQLNSCHNFASFFIVATQNSPVNFKAHAFSTLDKRTLSKFQFLDFRTFSGKHLLNSSCRLENASHFSFKFEEQWADLCNSSNKFWRNKSFPRGKHNYYISKGKYITYTTFILTSFLARYVKRV